MFNQHVNNGLKTLILKLSEHAEQPAMQRSKGFIYQKKETYLVLKTMVQSILADHSHYSYSLHKLVILLCCFKLCDPLA